MHKYQNNMADNKTADLKQEFHCSLCDFSCRYDYYGKHPPFSKSVVLLEDAYVIQDPFSPSPSHLTLGAKCSLCLCNVCVGQDCSLFYTKWFCVPCVKKNLSEFPEEIKAEISKIEEKKY